MISDGNHKLSVTKIYLCIILCNFLKDPFNKYNMCTLKANNLVRFKKHLTSVDV